jgi:hypothetical protein
LREDALDNLRGTDGSGQFADLLEPLTYFFSYHFGLCRRLCLHLLNSAQGLQKFSQQNFLPEIDNRSGGRFSDIVP